MGFRSRKSKDLTPKEFVEGANKTEEEMELQKVKNFNLRLSQEELALLKASTLKTLASEAAASVGAFEKLVAEICS